MALSGGRKILVRDREFRWKISGRRGRYGGAPRRPYLIVQEDSEKPGTPMCVYLESLRWVCEEEHSWVPHKASVTPKDVRLVIETALDKGWDPSSRSTFSLYTRAPVLELTDYIVSAPKGTQQR